ncbi:unnamed protein product [Meganyctiphanes norvegica]|uniref:Uncharacterized protein n=1 Tax=Meganyctiphanes norvegica TaxID=48144 RepID=A0AAV2QVS6_MEGNR
MTKNRKMTKRRIAMVNKGLQSNGLKSIVKKNTRTWRMAVSKKRKVIVTPGLHGKGLKSLVKKDTRSDRIESDLLKKSGIVNKNESLIIKNVHNEIKGSEGGIDKTITYLEDCIPVQKSVKEKEAIPESETKTPIPQNNCNKSNEDYSSQNLLEFEKDYAAKNLFECDKEKIFQRSESSILEKDISKSKRSESPILRRSNRALRQNGSKIENKSKAKMCIGNVQDLKTSTTKNIIECFPVKLVPSSQEQLLKDDKKIVQENKEIANGKSKEYSVKSSDINREIIGAKKLMNENGENPSKKLKESGYFSFHSDKESKNYDENEPFSKENQESRLTAKNEDMNTSELEMNNKEIKESKVIKPLETKEIDFHKMSGVIEKSNQVLLTEIRSLNNEIVSDSKPSESNSDILVEASEIKNQKKLGVEKSTNLSIKSNSKIAKESDINAFTRVENMTKKIEIAINETGNFKERNSPKENECIEKGPKEHGNTDHSEMKCLQRELDLSGVEGKSLDTEKIDSITDLLQKETISNTGFKYSEKQEHPTEKLVSKVAITTGQLSPNKSQTTFMAIPSTTIDIMPLINTNHFLQNDMQSASEKIKDVSTLSVEKISPQTKFEEIDIKDMQETEMYPEILENRQFSNHKNDIELHPLIATLKTIDTEDNSLKKDVILEVVNSNTEEILDHSLETKNKSKGEEIIKKSENPGEHMDTFIKSVMTVHHALERTKGLDKKLTDYDIISEKMEEKKVEDSSQNSSEGRLANEGCNKITVGEIKIKNKRKLTSPRKHLLVNNLSCVQPMRRLAIPKDKIHKSKLEEMGSKHIMHDCYNLMDNNINPSPKLPSPNESICINKDLLKETAVASPINRLLGSIGTSEEVKNENTNVTTSQLKVDLEKSIEPFKRVCQEKKSEEKKLFVEGLPSNASKEVSKKLNEDVRLQSIQEKIRSRSYIEYESLKQEIKSPIKNCKPVKEKKDDQELFSKNQEYKKMPPLRPIYESPLITQSVHLKKSDEFNVKNHQKMEFSGTDECFISKIRVEPNFSKEYDFHMEGAKTLSVLCNQSQSQMLIDDALEQKNKKLKIASLNTIDKQENNHSDCTGFSNNTESSPFVKHINDKTIENNQKLEEPPTKKRKLPPLRSIYDIKIKKEFDNKVLQIKNTEEHTKIDKKGIFLQEPVVVIEKLKISPDQIVNINEMDCAEEIQDVSIKMEPIDSAEILESSEIFESTEIFDTLTDRFKNLQQSLDFKLDEFKGWVDTIMEEKKTIQCRFDNVKMFLQSNITDIINTASKNANKPRMLRQSTVIKTVERKSMKCQQEELQMSPQKEWKVLNDDDEEIAWQMEDVHRIVEKIQIAKEKIHRQMLALRGHMVHDSDNIREQDMGTSSPSNHISQNIMKALHNIAEVRSQIQAHYSMDQTGDLSSETDIINFSLDDSQSMNFSLDDSQSIEDVILKEILKVRKLIALQDEILYRANENILRSKEKLNCQMSMMVGKLELLKSDTSDKQSSILRSLLSVDSNNETSNCVDPNFSECEVQNIGCKDKSSTQSKKKKMPPLKSIYKSSATISPSNVQNLNKLPFLLSNNEIHKEESASQIQLVNTTNNLLPNTDNGLYSNTKEESQNSAINFSSSPINSDHISKREKL